MLLININYIDTKLTSFIYFLEDIFASLQNVSMCIHEKLNNKQDKVYPALETLLFISFRNDIYINGHVLKNYMLIIKKNILL